MSEILLAPRGGLTFIVVVASDALADEAWPDYEFQQTRDSFDARRANVMDVISTGFGCVPVTRPGHERVTVGLERVDNPSVQ